MESTEKKPGWGGARKGAGRKATDRKNCTVRISPEAEAVLNSISGSKSDYINAAIMYYHSHHNH